MDAQEIITRNIEIAKMRGAKENTDNGYYEFPNGKVVGDYELAYHTDAWLMPVVRWVCNLYLTNDVTLKTKVILLSATPICYPTETIFIAASDFAKWYNQQKTK